MISTYDQTTYVTLPTIQAARALKRQIQQGSFSNWSLGKATAYRIVSDHYKRDARACALWRGLMRRAAQDAVIEAKYNLGIIKYTGGAR